MELISVPPYLSHADINYANLWVIIYLRTDSRTLCTAIIKRNTTEWSCSRVVIVNTSTARIPEPAPCVRLISRGTRRVARNYRTTYFHGFLIQTHSVCLFSSHNVNKYSVIFLDKYLFIQCVSCPSIPISLCLHVMKWGLFIILHTQTSIFVYMLCDTYNRSYFKMPTSGLLPPNDAQ